MRAILNGQAEPPPVAVTLGMKLLECSDGKATMAMTVGTGFHNPMGTLHGGVLISLADAAMGIALGSTLAEHETFTTLELKMNFLRPVISGRIVAEGNVVHRGATIALVEAVVRGDHGKVVARGTATQMILKVTKPVSTLGSTKARSETGLDRSGDSPHRSRGQK